MVVRARIHMPTENQVEVKTTTGAVMTAEGPNMTEIDDDQDHDLVAVALIDASQVDMTAVIVATAVTSTIAVTEGVRDMLVHAMSLMIMKRGAEETMSTGGTLVIDIQTAREIDPVADLETAARNDDQNPETMIVNATEIEASTMKK